MATATSPASAVNECQNKVTDNAYSSKAESKSFIHFCRLIARDTFYGFVFWSMFQGLAPMIWFYPLNELEISGYEVFALAFLSPVLCLIPGFLSLIQNKWILILLRLLVVGSLASFQAPTTLQRLVILAIGVGIAMLVLAASLWHPNKALRYRTFWGLILGIHLFLACRVWFVTFVPTWWDKESNSIIVATGAVFACGYILEDLADGEHESAPTIKHRTHWLPCGLSLGSLFCLTQMCFGEASLITRWTVKGYPNTGPVPLLWSSLVLLSLLSGTLVGRKYKHPVLIALLAAASMFTLYLHSNPYVAFAAGCCLAHLTMCLWPVTVEMATQSNPGLCLGVAALTYLVNVFFWVWTVAYNFVPYGEYTREHTDWLILMIMGSILLMTICYRKPVFDFTVSSIGKESLSMPNFGHYAKVLFLIFLVGQCGMVKRFNKYQPGPRPKADHKTFTAGIWTFHFGYDNKGWPSMERAAQMINDTGVDVLTLLESDASKIFLGNNDLATWLGERLNFYVDFGPSTKDHTWGNLILSKYPIVKSVHHLLPSPEGELAPAITASINISGTIVDFVVTHMGNDRDVLDRKLQSQYLAKELKNSLNPAVFLGYVTSAPGSDNYHRLLTDGEMKDIDPSDKYRWCEYIMYKRLIRMGYARISHGGLSDTEVQIGTFRIPQNMKSYQDNKRTTVAPEKHNIDKNVIFNSKFGKYHRGHGHFDHHGFHMDTPKYFYND